MMENTIKFLPCKNFRSKNSQATVFIILGILILVVGGIYFFTAVEEREEIVPGVFVSVKEIPREIGPLNNFVSECLEDISVRGIKLIGEHGGYISLDELESTRQDFIIKNNPTESDAVIFAPGGNLKIPYWWHLQSSNKCEGSCNFASKRPPLRNGENSIESQLNKYIKTELPSCINNFESLRKQGFEISELGEIKIETKIAEDDIVVILDYELEAKKQDAKMRLEQFFVRIPVDLQKIYNLATEITNLQQQYRFLERQTMNLISSFASVDEKKLPPITEIRFEFGTTTSWSKDDVKEKVAQILMSYIPLFQVDGTGNFNRDFYSNGLKQRLYDSMIIPVAEQKYSNLDATFNYLDFWPIYFDLNCNGDVCGAESTSSNILSFIGLQRYNFVYDISFPTLVEIFDEAALNNRGYKFNFFLEANIRNNKELPANFQPLEAVSAPASFLCGLGNRNSGEITVKVADEASSKPLQDVSVAISAVGDSCYIGKTDENGHLVSRFPTGTVGAVVSLIKPDYITKFRLFDAGINEESFIEERLEPIFEKKLIVKKKLVEKKDKGWEFTNKISELSTKEEAFVTLTRISPLTEEEFSAAAAFKGLSAQDIRIAPGEYQVNINMFLRDKIVIPEKKKKVGSFFFEEVFTIPRIEFNETNPYPSGGLRLNVTITKSDLQKDVIIVYAVSPALQDVPEQKRSIEDLEQINKIEEYSKVFASLLKPVYK